MMRYRDGNSLIEYVLPLAVLFVSGLVLIFATDLPDRLAKYMMDTMNGTRDGGSISVQPLGTLASGDSVDWIETAGGSGMEIGDPPNADSPGSGGAYGDGGNTETAGGLGGEQGGQGGSDNRLNEIAEDLEDENPELANLVTELANLGHDAARLQRDMPRFGMMGSTNAQKIADIYRQLRGAGGVLDQFKAKLDAVMASNPDEQTKRRIQREANQIIAIIEQIEVQYNLNEDMLLMDERDMVRSIDDNYSKPTRPGRGGGTVTTSGGNAGGTETGSNNTCGQGGDQSSCNQDSDGDGQTSGGNQGQGQGGGG